MKYLLISGIIFGVVFIQAQEKNIHQVFDGIGRTADDLFALAKSTLEEDCYKRKETAQLFLSLPGESIESDDKIKTIGEYLNATTNEALRVRIERDCIDQGNVLLNDFFKTVMPKALRKKIEKFVSVVTSGALFTPEESRTLRELNVFYPDSYESSVYTWKPLFRDGEIDALTGRLYKIVGLRGNQSKLDSMIAIIDITYTCRLRHIEERRAVFKGSTVKNIGPHFKAYIEPRHDMMVSITFLRDHARSGFSAVEYRCYAFGGERIFSSVDGESMTNWLKQYVEVPKGSGNWALQDLISELDLQASAYDSSVAEEFLITSAMDNSSCHDLIAQCSDFIIKTPDPMSKYISHNK